MINNFIEAIHKDMILRVLRKQPVRVKRRFKGAEIANGSLVHRGYVFIVFVLLMRFNSASTHKSP